MFLLAGVQSSAMRGIFFILCNELFQIIFFLIVTSYISVQFRLQVGGEIQTLSAFKILRWHFSKHHLGEKILLLFVLSSLAWFHKSVFWYKPALSSLLNLINSSGPTSLQFNNMKS